MLCKQCGIKDAVTWKDLCLDCFRWQTEDIRQVYLLHAQGHTRHCACRQVWGDGECECGRMPFTTA
jgi:hypothetical protein